MGIGIQSVDRIEMIVAYSQDVTNQLFNGLLDSLAITLYVVGGVLLRNAVKRRGLKMGLYRSDPPVTHLDTPDDRSAVKAAIWGASATLVGSLISAIATVVAANV
jgi:heme/copper-type cytochrome/quinol oxidase subunit 1